MRRQKIDHVAHNIQARKQALAMWDRIYTAFKEGKETQENIRMAMTVLNSVDHGICNSPYLSYEEKERVWRETT